MMIFARRTFGIGLPPRLFAAAAMGLLCVLLGCTAESGRTGTSGDGGKLEELRFGIIATESTIGLRNEFEPFLDDMSKALGIPVECYFASDYAGVIEAMRFGKVDLGWFGNKSAIEAVDRAGGQVFAQTVSADGESGYWSTLIVHVDSPYKTVDDLVRNADKLAFGNGDPHSTSGFLIPSYFLWRDLGIDPKQTFKTVINSNHETNALSVANRQVDFATCSTEVLEQIKTQRPKVHQKLRVVWTSPLIPADPLVWRKNLPESLKESISEFVFGYGQPGPQQDHQLQVLSGISAGWAPLRPSTDDQLLPLREMIVANRMVELQRDGEHNSDEYETLREELLTIRARRQQIQSSTDQSDAEDPGDDR